MVLEDPRSPAAFALARRAARALGQAVFADAALQATRFLDLAICGDALDVLPSLADGDYDCVLMLDVLEQVSDTAGILRLASRKLAADGVLVWVNPLQDGERTREALDPLLREVAAKGPWVSAHPDIILKMGVKEVLYRTRHLGWGADTHLYRSAAEFRA